MEKSPKLVQDGNIKVPFPFFFFCYIQPNRGETLPGGLNDISEIGSIDNGARAGTKPVDDKLPKFNTGLLDRLNLYNLFMVVSGVAQ